jgi:hypothetical protein
MDNIILGHIVLNVTDQLFNRIEEISITTSRTIKDLTSIFVLKTSEI